MERGDDGDKDIVPSDRPSQPPVEPRSPMPSDTEKSSESPDSETGDDECVTSIEFGACRLVELVCRLRSARIG